MRYRRGRVRLLRACQFDPAHECDAASEEWNINRRRKRKGLPRILHPRCTRCDRCLSRSLHNWM